MTASTTPRLGLAILPRLISISLISLFIFLTVISALSTIRVQVNNENIQSPPYLLEALKEIDKVANQSQSSLLVQANRTTTIIHQLSEDGRASSWSPDTPLMAPAPALASSHNEISAAAAASSHDSSLSLGDQPAENEPSEAESHLLEAPVDMQSEQQTAKQQQQPQASAKKVSSQLPVANSHLKKPIGSPLEPDEHDSLASNEHSSAVPKSDSLVSPSVAFEEQPKVQENVSSSATGGPAGGQFWSNQQQLVQQASANRSLAIKPIRLVSIQSRTRITAAGNHESLDSQSSESQSDRLADYEQEEQAGASAAAHATDSPDSGSPEGEHKGRDRVIKVPERIVMSADPPKQVQQTIRLTLNRTRLGKPDPQCPPNETVTFEHERHCDKYYFCDDGYKSEHTCPNGLMYGTQKPVKDYCVHRWHAVCLEKTIPNPISSPGCRWQYGIFSVQGSPRCSPDYFECIAGRYEVRKCNVEGQVYDDRSKACQYAERVGCPEEVLSDFQCPQNDQDNVYWPVPRYFLNDRTLVHCINDRPRVIRCADNERADPENLHCVPTNRHEVPSIERKVREERRG